MTRDDVKRMAIECQLVTPGNSDGVYMDALERFAALVVAIERERQMIGYKEADSIQAGNEI